MEKSNIFGFLKALTPRFEGFGGFCLLLCFRTVVAPSGSIICGLNLAIEDAVWRTTMQFEISLKTRERIGGGTVSTWPISSAISTWIHCKTNSTRCCVQKTNTHTHDSHNCWVPILAQTITITKRNTAKLRPHANVQNIGADRTRKKNNMTNHRECGQRKRANTERNTHLMTHGPREQRLSSPNLRHETPH